MKYLTWMLRIAGPKSIGPPFEVQAAFISARRRDIGRSRSDSASNAKAGHVRPALEMLPRSASRSLHDDGPFHPERRMEQAVVFERALRRERQAVALTREQRT